MTSIGAAAAALALAVLLTPASAHAQATADHTWVSGLGDDVNPCSRTSPCRTFAGAISKTSDGGIISVLDPGGFGAVTITKSLTIHGDEATTSILGYGTTGLTVNSATAVVHLRGLFIQGNNAAAFNGITIAAAAAVYLEHCTIRHFAGSAISVQPASSPAKLFVSECSLALNGTGVSASGADSEVFLDRVRLVRNQSGIVSRNNHTIFHLNNSVLADNKIAIDRVDGRIVSSRSNALVGNGSNGQGIGAEPFR